MTGNGYKTAEVVTGKLDEPVQLSRAFKDFEAWWDRQCKPVGEFVSW